jgi:hypothetical protein
MLTEKDRQERNKQRCLRYAETHRQEARDRANKHYQNNKSEHGKYTHEYYEKHKERIKRYAREYYQRNRKRQRHVKVAYKFGLSADQYEAMIEKQGNVCAICHEPEHRVDGKSKRLRELAVDHNHQTGKVRGLLCNACNAALGGFGDNVERLFSAAEYLREHGVRE